MEFNILTQSLFYFSQISKILFHIMIESKNKELINFFLTFMASKNDLIDLLNDNNVSGFSKSFTIPKLIDFLESNEEFTLNKKNITKFARNKFLPHLYNIDFQKQIIKSGKLKDHSWHQAAPSRLHLTIQRWVRLFLSGEMTFEDYMKRIKNVAKQEIYILVGANITEYLIVNADETIIPNLKKMGISDVIINNLPYDVKNTHNPKTLPYNLRKEPMKCQEWLFDSGDLQRDLKTAQRAPLYYGYNRIYVIIDPVEKWETEMDSICKFIQDYIKNIVNKTKKPHIFKRNKNSREIKIHTHLIIP